MTSISKLFPTIVTKWI